MKAFARNVLPGAILGGGCCWAATAAGLSR